MSEFVRGVAGEQLSSALRESIVEREKEARRRARRVAARRRGVRSLLRPDNARAPCPCWDRTLADGRDGPAQGPVPTIRFGRSDRARRAAACGGASVQRRLPCRRPPRGGVLRIGLSVELSRPFRGPRLWLPLKLFGLAPFRAALEEKLLLARYLHARLSETPRWVVGHEPDLSIVTFRYPPERGHADEFNRRLLEAVLADGSTVISGTKTRRQYTLRAGILHYPQPPRASGRSPRGTETRSAPARSIMSSGRRPRQMAAHARRAKTPSASSFRAFASPRRAVPAALAQSPRPLMREPPPGHRRRVSGGVHQPRSRRESTRGSVHCVVAVSKGDPTS
jgi:hypothetical protein